MWKENCTTHGQKHREDEKAWIFKEAEPSSTGFMSLELNNKMHCYEADKCLLTLAFLSIYKTVAYLT